MAKEDKKDGWKEFFWNPRTSEFCGRTASSWGKCCFPHPHMLISVPLFCSYNKHSAAICSDSESHFVSAEAHWRDESLSEVLKLQLVLLVRHMRFLFSAACLRSRKT